MAVSYDNRKKSYDAMDDSQKQKYNEMAQSKGDSHIANKYIKQWQQEQTNNTPQQTSNESNFNNQNGTNGQKPLNQTLSNNNNEQKPLYNQDEEGFYTGNSEWEKAQNRQKLRDIGAGAMSEEEYQKSQTVSPDLDQSKFNQAPGQITVKEGTAAQTGKPDYTISTDARLNEMKSNLDQYFQDSPRMFSDRETFNKVFNYSGRESEAQRQLLDSYWKRKEDMDKASTYTSGEAINNGMKNGEITTDQLNLLKEYNPEAYQKWQQLQEDEIMKRIVNDIVPKTVEEISGKINSMIEALGIQAQDALDIEGIYNDTMAKVGAYQTLEDCNRTVKQIEEVINKKTAIMNRYANSTGGTVSDALAAARMAKAIAPYNEQLQGLQYQYQDYSNLYSQKTATAYQAANLRAMQAQENQRIWQQKCSALGFATSALSYRTPEETLQNNLKVQQAQNEMALLQQSRQNDLALYNQYTTAKMKAQLQNEMYDLNVSDPAQLRSNLNNVLSMYYDEYGVMIQRSQAQAVDDILKYAKDNNVSVAQALTENFIKQLQQKPQYQAQLNKQTGYDPYANQQQWQYVMDEDGNVSLKITGYGEIPESAFKDRGSRQEAYEDVYNYAGGNSVDYVQCLSESIKDGSYGGQCGAFVNDILTASGADRVFGDSLKQKIETCNVTKEEGPQAGYAAVFDFGHKSSDGINHGHVAMITKVNDDGSIEVLESNYNGDKTIRTHTYSAQTVKSSIVGYYKPENYSTQTLQPRENTTTTQDGSIVHTQWGDYDKQYESYFKKWLTDTEGAKLTDADKKYVREKLGDKFDGQLYAFQMEQESKGSKNALNVLKTIQEFENLGGADRDRGSIGALGTRMFDTAEYNKFQQLIKQLQLQELFNAKANGASFGAMSDAEWEVLRDASTSLSWGQMWGFNTELENIKQALWTAAFNNDNFSKENWQAYKDAHPLASQTTVSTSNLKTPMNTSTVFGNQNNGYNMSFISNK